MLCVAILTLTNRCLEDCRMICRAAACLTLCLLLWIADCDAQPVGTVNNKCGGFTCKYIAPRGKLLAFLFPQERVDVGHLVRVGVRQPAHA